MTNIANIMPSAARILVLTCTMTGMLTLQAVAQEASRDDRGGDRKGPPQEAITACENASKGDSCSMEGRRGDTLSGECDMRGKQEKLVCVPEGHDERKKSRRNERDSD